VVLTHPPVQWVWWTFSGDVVTRVLNDHTPSSKFEVNVRARGMFRDNFGSTVCDTFFMRCGCHVL
jgi:hypothetical protein